MPECQCCSPKFAVSFACPHFKSDEEYCLRLKTDCVPGRRGCVLESNSVFAVPAEIRVREREEEKRRLPALGPDHRRPDGGLRRP